MPLIKDGSEIHDPYVRVTDDEAVPEEGAVLVNAARLLSGDVPERTDPLGVVWPNDRLVDELIPHLGQLALIALVFPKFKDGRAYSQARQLRERLGFAGELRAIGEVLRDQFLFMLRAGFDAFEVKKDKDAAAFAQTVNRYTVFYQPAGDDEPPAFRRRLVDGRPRRPPSPDFTI